MTMQHFTNDSPILRPNDTAYPGGEDDLAYRWAFNVWAVLFLGVICAGLLNYLGTYTKTLWPN